MDSLMQKIFRVAEREGATRVTCVSVWLGALSHMSKEHFQEHFDIAAENTIAQGAFLEMEESQDLTHPQAQSILLKSIGVDS